MRFCAVGFVAGIFLCSCNSEKSGPALFEKIPSDHSGISFVNTVENSKEFNIFNYRNFYNGGGVAIGDLNNDGLADVYLTSNLGDNKLYINRGDFKFEDLTASAGVAGQKFWSTGVVMVDINADGWLDLYVCNAGYRKDQKPENELFINNGPGADGKWSGTFTEKAAEYGLNEDGYTTHAAFFDYDLDGDLDCYILNNSFMPVNTLNNSNNRDLYAEDWPVKDFLKGGGDKLLRNDKGKFVNVSKAAGIYGSLIGFGLGVTVGDVNGDGWPDLYISNDFYERDYFYINQRNGTFREEIERWVQHLSLASMGADLADVNNDGYPDIFTTEMLPGEETRLKTSTSFENYNIYKLKLQAGFYHQYMQNCLHLNSAPQPAHIGKQEGAAFREIAFHAGVAASDWSWGALLFDMDGDGWRDIYICNGIYKDVIDQDFIDFFADEIIQKMALTGKKEEIEKVIDKMPSVAIPNKVFRNRASGAVPSFEDTGAKWGMNTPSFSNGAAYGDLDNDGDLDLVVNNVNMECFVFRNNSEKNQPQNHYLSIQLKGEGQNTFAIGSKVWVFADSVIQSAELIPSRGFQSSVDYNMVFGLAQNATVDSVVVVWYDQKRSVVRNPKIDQKIALQHTEAQPGGGRFIQTNTASNPYFEALASPFATHRENDFVDFYPEPLTLRMLSREGPKAAVGDVNADGLDDVYLCGAGGQASQLYFQSPRGFEISKQAAFVSDSAFEDTAALLFDADGDKDLDLFVGSGGNEHEIGARLLQDRLYRNDGKGNFTIDPMAIVSVNGYNTAVAVALDFDEDGDQDLFVGTRSVPGQYAVPPRHYFYVNDGQGRFKDAAKEIAGDLKLIGMVTDATLANVAGDARPELIVVGEWMAPQVFAMSKSGLKKVTSNLDDYPGWWSAVAADDVDGDGDQDLVLGNRGSNFYFNGTAEAPAKLWVWDFDNNGTVEKILTRNIGGRDMPVLMKKDLTSQIPSLKKQNLKHVDYSKKAIQDLFPADLLKKAMLRKATCFLSAVALNNGDGQFAFQPLPDQAQLSCVKAIHLADLNGDGKRDLVLGGNDAGFMPQFSKLDASYGHTLLNEGKGRFSWVENAASGFFVQGDIKQIFELKKGAERWLVALVNGAKPAVFKRIDPVTQ